jgi:hypothetical protein
VYLLPINLFQEMLFFRILYSNIFFKLVAINQVATNSHGFYKYLKLFASCYLYIINYESIDLVVPNFPILLSKYSIKVGFIEDQKRGLYKCIPFSNFAF